MMFFITWIYTSIKSQFLRYATALCPRSVLTSGAGTTSAGLTCAAVREGSGKEFTLEAGALVLADRGVCAIDEFSCMDAKDRTSIHEAMEQQTLSVAKAGIVCKLNCRATVIAVTNAKGGIYDHEKTFTSNIGIEPPLLSRFDLIFKLIDGSDPSKDDNVATFLLNRAIQVCLPLLSILRFFAIGTTLSLDYATSSGYTLSRIIVGFWIRMYKKD